MGMDAHIIANRGNELVDIAYWRNAGPVNWWMRDLHLKKTGYPPESCFEINMDADDLESIRVECIDMDSALNQYIITILSAVKLGREMIDAGYSVRYSCQI